MKYFAISDNRELKAKKIQAVLCDFLGTDIIRGNKILDLGCGSGLIAEYFSHTNDVIAADTVEQMTIAKTSSVQFKRIDTGPLPFDDNSFDIVIFNHVIACVADQSGQMKEIYRVLKKEGICYFASVNRYFPIEGFTKLPLVHYLPNRAFQSLYKRVKKSDDDLFPVGYHKIVSLIKNAGFSYREYSTDIMRNPAKYHSEYALPFNLLLPKCISPTAIFVLTK